MQGGDHVWGLVSVSRTLVAAASVLVHYWNIIIVIIRIQFITVQRIKTLYDSFSYGQFSSYSPYINIWLLNRSSRTYVYLRNSNDYKFIFYVSEYTIVIMKYHWSDVGK